MGTIGQGMVCTHMYNNQNEFGRSMIEAVGVLSVMGLLTAAAFVLITSATASQRVSRAQDDIANIEMTIRSMSAVSRDFSNLGCGDGSVCESRDLLRDLNLPTVTPFGDNSFYSVVYDPQYPEVFGVRINNMDTRYCDGLNFKSFRGAIAGGCGYEYTVKSDVRTVNIADKLQGFSIDKNLSERTMDKDTKKEKITYSFSMGAKDTDFFSVYFQK